MICCMDHLGTIFTKKKVLTNILTNSDFMVLYPTFAEPWGTAGQTLINADIEDKINKKTETF